MNLKDRKVFIWDKNRDPEDDHHVPLDRAYTFDKLILSPTCLSDKSAFTRIRGYQRYLRTDMNSKRLVNPLTHPSSSYSLIQHLLASYTAACSLLFINEDLYMHESYLFLSFLIQIRSLLPRTFTFHFINITS